jgi:hypothetical protein
MHEGSSTPTGNLGMVVTSTDGQTHVVDPFTGWRGTGEPGTRLRDYLTDALPARGMTDAVNEYRTRNLPNIWRGFRRVATARSLRLATFYGALYGRVIHADGSEDDLGLISLRVVTTAGVTAICSHLNNNGATISTFNFHGYGTGGAAEAVGNTALTTELTTEYVVNSTRPTGSQAASTNTYTTVGTLSPDSGGTIAVTEHGVFSASSAGTLLDRSLFSAVNLVASADSLQTTYVLTLPAGS